jgi:prepilin-type N-terminal cleavage/methylation domain-containing protein
MHTQKQKGFTLPELVIVTGIITTLLGFITINLFKVQQSSSVKGTSSLLVSDMRGQQTKAMVGSSEGRVTADSYGIYFQTDRYILFHGLTYNASDPANFTVMLDTNISASNTFPNNSLIFSQISGEMVGYTGGNNTVTIKNTAGTEQRTITVNRYGVVIGD